MAGRSRCVQDDDVPVTLGWRLVARTNLGERTRYLPPDEKASLGSADPRVRRRCHGCSRHRLVLGVSAVCPGHQVFAHTRRSRMGGRPLSGKGMDGGPWTKAQTRCFDLHLENATAEAAEPYRLLSTRRNVPLMLSVGLLAVSGIGLILEPCCRDKRSGSHRSTPPCAHTELSRQSRGILPLPTPTPMTLRPDKCSINSRVSGSSSLPAAKRPKTVGPLPVITAPAAPPSSNNSFTRPI
jgi:hypothetical protein